MNTTELLASIKRGCSVPANQNRFTDADILAIADEEIQTKLLPVLLSLRQEYLVTKEQLTLTPSQAGYAIPVRSIGRTLRSLAIISGSTTSYLNYIDPSDIAGSQSNGIPTSFYFEGDKFILYPTPASASVLEIKYEMRPSDLTDVANCGLITAINTAGNYITISSTPSSIIVGAVVDFISDYAILSKDATVTNVSGTNIYFTSLPTGLAVNNYIALAKFSPLVQLPREMHQVLSQAVECRLLEALGDFEGLGASAQKLTEKTNAMLSLLAPRQKGSQQKIVQFNGLLNRARSRFNA